MKSASDKFSTGATFYAACGVLATVALAQVVLGLWGWQKQLAARETALQAQRSVAVEPVKAPVPAPISVEADEHLVAAEPMPTLISPPIRKAETSKPLPQTLDVPIVDPEIVELLNVGLNARQKNDMSAAVQAFKAAWLKQPDHPKLNYQLAHTYDLMGLEGKAQPLWNTLINLGRAGGDYYQLAEMRLKKKGAITPGPAELEERENKLSITDIKLANVPGVYGGQKKLLSFTIKKLTQEPIPSDAILAGVHFFDLVNDKWIDRTTARQPSATKVSAPEDWTTRGLERWEVLYDQAEMTPQDIMKFGQRKFYGYALQIYLADAAKPKEVPRLQDVVAEPAELENFAQEMPVPPPDNEADSSLFPK